MSALRSLALAVALGTLAAATAHAQGRTDVVTLANGDRITGEIINLERGQLEFKTDDAGTLYLEWDKLVSLVAARVFEVGTADGRWFLGTLARGADRALAVVAAGQTISLPMLEVTQVTPIGRSFWSKLDGSIDVGFSYTRSSGVAQLNVNSDTVYRKPAFQGRLSASLTQTEQDDGSGGDDRASVDVSYLRYRWQRWYVGAAARFENNESLGIVLRSQVGFAMGPRLVNSNRAQLALGAGVSVNDEQGVDVPATQNVEALFLFTWSYYTYDRPKTTIDINWQYYPSLSDLGRHRVQFDAGVKRELWKDFFVSLNGYNSYDNRPPNPTADTNDVGVVLSIGWSY
ncbi:MAG TPA: DUF481 domain-containing protein [Vicinamibacterales bacterium]